MRKTLLNSISRGLLGLAMLVFAGCEKDQDETAGMDPFSNDSGERNKIVVISDVHLGADLRWAECNKNLELLERFLLKVRNSEGVKELVIAGDLLDEWFVPATIDTYGGKKQSDFVKRLAEANKGVFDAFNNIIRDGKILVTYVPGNHDLTVEEECVELILPGINQARDSEKLGLGTYSPEGQSKIAIEHGHRYNFFCAPDMLSNQDIAQGSILPPGYFFTRLAALSVVEGLIFQPGKHIELDEPTSGNSQILLYKYWNLWKWTVENFTIKESLDDEIFVTNINGFTGKYSVNDLLPYQASEGQIDVNLYKGIQDNWEERQTQNNVSVHMSVDHAITYANSADETDDLAKTQYFQNPGSEKRIVVFGHNHRDTLLTSTDHNDRKTIYANSGTWIDHPSHGDKTANFIVITPQDDSDAESETVVKVYNFKNEAITEEHSHSVRL